MKFILWIVVGGLIGWFASMIMGTNVRQRILLNVLVGIAGAFLGGWVLDGRLGSSIINQGNFSASGLVVPLLGASILLAFVRLVRGSATHSRRREN